METPRFSRRSSPHMLHRVPGAAPAFTPFTASPMFPSPGAWHVLSSSSRKLSPIPAAENNPRNPKSADVQLCWARGPMEGGWDGGPHLLTGYVGSDPQLLPKAPPGGICVGRAEQRGSVQARERGGLIIRCWSNPKDALSPWERAAGAWHVEVRWVYLKKNFFLKD